MFKYSLFFASEWRPFPNIQLWSNYWCPHDFQPRVHLRDNPIFKTRIISWRLSKKRHGFWRGVGQGFFYGLDQSFYFFLVWHIEPMIHPWTPARVNMPIIWWDRGARRGPIYCYKIWDWGLSRWSSSCFFWVGSWPGMMICRTVHWLWLVWS